MDLRNGTVADIEPLNALAFAAKAHWGYSAEELHAWRSDLEVEADSLGRRPICVAEINGNIVGFIQVGTDVEPWELWGLWVHPSHMGQGVGRALLRWAGRLVAEAGQRELAIDADPNAEAFYLACGARRVGAIAAPIDGQPDRVRPQLLLQVSVNDSGSKRIIRRGCRGRR